MQELKQCSYLIYLFAAFLWCSTLEINGYGDILQSWSGWPTEDVAIELLAMLSDFFFNIGTVLWWFNVLTFPLMAFVLAKYSRTHWGIRLLTVAVVLWLLKPVSIVSVWVGCALTLCFRYLL